VLDSPGSTTTKGIVPSTKRRGPGTEWREEARILTCVNVWGIALRSLGLGSSPQDLRQAQLGQAPSAKEGALALEGAATLAVALIRNSAKPGQIDILDQASAAFRLQEKGVIMCADMCAVARVCIRTCC